MDTLENVDFSQIWGWVAVSLLPYTIVYIVVYAITVYLLALILNGIYWDILKYRNEGKVVFLILVSVLLAFPIPYFILKMLFNYQISIVGVVIAGIASVATFFALLAHGNKI